MLNLSKNPCRNPLQLLVRITIFPPDVTFAGSESQEWTSLVNLKFLVGITPNRDCLSVQER